MNFKEVSSYIYLLANICTSILANIEMRFSAKYNYKQIIVLYGRPLGVYSSHTENALMKSKPYFIFILAAFFNINETFLNINYAIIYCVIIRLDVCVGVNLTMNGNQ